MVPALSIFLLLISEAYSSLLTLLSSSSLGILPYLFLYSYLINLSSLSQALGITIQPSTRYLMSIHHPYHPFGEAFNAIGRRVVGAAAHLQSLIIHYIVEAISPEDLLIPPSPSHPQ
jgi:hypothetical protein